MDSIICQYAGLFQSFLIVCLVFAGYRWIKKKVFNKKNVPKISLVEFELKTGRTHQIRVHMIYKGTSLLGDQKYRKKNMKFKKIDKTFEEILNSFKGQVLHFQMPKSPS